ncbi:MAG TPA: hypothetical protein VH796_08750 [Nitrososphaeraceae archaeon]|jgi:hypothetical protein
MAQTRIKGIVIVFYDLPPEGYSLVYHYVDHISVKHGIDYFDVTENRQMHMIGFSADNDARYYPGIK